MCILKCKTCPCRVNFCKNSLYINVKIHELRFGNVHILQNHILKVTDIIPGRMMGGIPLFLGRGNYYLLSDPF